MSETTPATTEEETAPDEGGVLAASPEFAQFTPGAAADGAEHPLGAFHDVPVSITARLGKVTLPIKQVLQLRPGSVVELDRLANQPVELTVGDLVFARGEVVVVDEQFAVRIQELVRPGKVEEA